MVNSMYEGAMVIPGLEHSMMPRTTRQPREKPKKIKVTTGSPDESSAYHQRESAVISFVYFSLIYVHLCLNFPQKCLHAHLPQHLLEFKLLTNVLTAHHKQLRRAKAQTFCDVFLENSHNWEWIW